MLKSKVLKLEYIWFGIEMGDAEEPDFTVLEDVPPLNEEKKKKNPSEPFRYKNTNLIKTLTHTRME